MTDSYREKITEKFNEVINDQDISIKLEESIYNWCINELNKKGEVLDKSQDLFKKIYLNNKFNF